ncbi:MAG: DNA gyrase inhibitor YacG [Pseudomonadales bacterium]|nr:DNA gyrase inhibitor YacG [Pseudomonadales bacterium]
MTGNTQTIHACPACKSSISYSADNPFRPFCSDSCKNQDFMQWANQQHSIAGSPSFDDLMSEQVLADIQQARESGFDFDQ